MSDTDRLTIDELRDRFNKDVKPKKHHRNEESLLQRSCIKWFRLQYPELSGVLFAVPNGGRRDAKTGAELKKEGVVAGVADLLLLKSNRFYGYMAIEMKTRTGRQRDSQKAFEAAVNTSGGTYKLVRSIGEFMSTVKDYLSDV